MRSKSAKRVSCLLFVILSQAITVTCQNETTPTTSPEELNTSSHPLTSSAAESTGEKQPSTTKTTKPLDVEKTTATTKPLTTPQLPEEKTTTPPEMKTSGTKSVAMTTSHPTHPPVHNSEPTHHTKPIHPGDVIHHGDKNNTNKTEDGHGVGPGGSHSTMGYPDEPPVVEASSGDEEEDDSWQISIYVVCGLLIGMVVFVVVMVIKNNREMKRRASLRKRKRPAARKDNAVVLNMTKLEERKKTHGTEKKKEEKRLSMHSRVGTEESIPLLQLHIGDGEHPVLSNKSEEQETQPIEPSTSYKDSKPLVEENANTVYSTGTFI